jgi:hypothetical protein
MHEYDLRDGLYSQNSSVRTGEVEVGEKRFAKVHKLAIRPYNWQVQLAVRPRVLGVFGYLSRIQKTRATRCSVRHRTPSPSPDCIAQWLGFLGLSQP